ncbi:MAG: NAD(P)-binding protein [Nitrospirae bacterium]|nr:NAD(P)-binding protein [Nitrospirota bacterium]
MHRPKDASDRIVILGGGLTGLTAGLVLSRAGRSVQVLERGPEVGGLARTIARNGFRFDLSRAPATRPGSRSRSRSTWPRASSTRARSTSSRSPAAPGAPPSR